MYDPSVRPQTVILLSIHREGHHAAGIIGEPSYGVVVGRDRCGRGTMGEASLRSQYGGGILEPGVITSS